MTAVDPQRLAREIDALGVELENPKALRSRVVALLDIYADRTRRTGAGVNPARAPRSFDVPSPIMRSLKRYLSQQLIEKPELAREIADELWLAGYRETQMLAAEVLSVHPVEQVAGWVEARAGESVDSTTLESLAGNSLSAWRQADPQGFLEKISLWLRGENSRIKTLALHALTAAVQEPVFEDLPTIYRLLQSFETPLRGELKRAMFELVAALAKRSPAETTHFLLERLRSGGAAAKRLARHVQDDLPAQQRSAIAKALSG